jgi:hypothetical protein
VRRLGAVGLGALALAAPAAARAPVAVSVVVVPPDVARAHWREGAAGLLVPAAGQTVTRAGALAALVRGRTRKDILGGHPGGPPLIRLSQRPAAITFWVSLPPPGTHANDRYPIAVTGGGYGGLLRSSATRVPGLVSIADVAPSAVALAAGRRPALTSSRAAHPATTLARLDRRLASQGRNHNVAVAILAAAVFVGSLLALATRSRYVGRTALLAAPLTLAAAIGVAASGATRDAVVLGGIAAVVLALALGGGAVRAVGVLCGALVVAYLVVLVARPEWAALAPIGPNPHEGGRFYGTTNLTTTVLVTVALMAASAVPSAAALVVAAAAIAIVGWSRAGADGGGLLVVLVAGAVFALRTRGRRLTPRTAAIGAVATVGLAAALVGIDAATGGSSHVTRKLGEGPDAVLDELWHRLEISWGQLSSSWHAPLVFAAGMIGLAVLATRRPRFAAGDALLAALAISLLVNDTPQDVAAGGALSYGVLWAWQRVDSAPDAPPPLDPAGDRAGARRRGLRRGGHADARDGDRQGRGAAAGAG